MKKEQITFAFILTYLWVLMILLGAIIFETLILYPDIFHDVPRSFETAKAFMVVTGPSNLFPPIGMLAILTGLGSLILGWNVKQARYWVLGSLSTIVVGEFLFSALFFWPRNTIMFEEGTAVHSAAFLQQTALEFQIGHWFRLALSAAAAVMAFVGFLKLYRILIEDSASKV